MIMMDKDGQQSINESIDQSMNQSINQSHYYSHSLKKPTTLLATQAHNIKRFIHVSTDEVYGENKAGSDEQFHESATFDPTNPYAATKACAEMLVKAYAQSYHLPLIVTRGNNVSVLWGVCVCVCV